MLNLLVDVDTGVDDALALAFLARHPGVHLLAVTCVAGNTNVGQATRNTLDVLHLAGRDDVPVASGAREPLVEPARAASGFHGATGLADVDIPASPREPQPEHAVELIRRTVLESARPVTLLALGPLTNIALFVRMHPEVAAKLERIVFMGGSASAGNATPVAEFNVWHDPEAAAIVLTAPVPKIMYGLDVFHQVAVAADDYRRLLASADPLQRFAGRLLEYADGFAVGDAPLGLGALLGDAGAACATVEPRLVGVHELPAAVELAPGHSRGQTVVDRRPVPGEEEQHGLSAQRHALGVALTVDSARMVELFLNTLQEAPTMRRGEHR